MLNLNKLYQQLQTSLKHSSIIMDGQKVDLQEILLVITEKYLKDIPKWERLSKGGIITDYSVDTRRFFLKKKVGYETWVTINFENIDSKIFSKTLDKFISELTKVIKQYDKSSVIKKKMSVDYGVKRAAIMDDKTVVYYSYSVVEREEGWVTISIGMEAPDKAALLKNYTGDDKVIKKISNLLKGSISKSIDNVVKVFDITSSRDYDYIVQNYAPSVNKQIKALFNLCTKIKDKQLSNKVLSFLQDVFCTKYDDLDNALQNFFNATNYKSLDFDELAELTLDNYIRTHNIDVIV